MGRIYVRLSIRLYKRKVKIEQLSIIGQIIEKKNEYRQNMWQLFIDLKKSYDSIHRNSLYKIILEFGFLQRLIQLTICVENTQYRVKVDNTELYPSQLNRV